MTITLMNEDHTATVQTWRLLRARPVSYVGGPFDARCSSAASEAITLAYEWLELE